MLPVFRALRTAMAQTPADTSAAERRASVELDVNFVEVSRHADTAAPTDGDGTTGVVDAPSPAAPAPQAQSQPAEEEQETPIEELVGQAVIHLDKPIERLPAITPPELKLIGRCVTFKGDTTINGEVRSFFYEGLVGTINKETVMLIHVHRYTEEDFQVHKLERRQAAAEDKLKLPTSFGAAASSISGAAGAVVSAEHRGAAAREEIEANRDGSVSCVPNSSAAETKPKPNGTDFDFDHHSVAVSEHQEMPDLLNEMGETHAEVTTRVRNRMRQQTGTMGPIPYVTFSRAHIHRVEFGVDPRSSFYSIFTDPTKRFFDMQCLRMFVRRYIIHTSQGNNPREVPLRAFIACRCNCPAIDNDLLVCTAREELAHLIKIDRDVRRLKKKKEQSRRNVLRAYRAPNGLFRMTGVLYLTHLPRQTITIAVMEMIVALAMLVYIVSTILTAERTVVQMYFYKVYSYVFATVGMAVLSGGCTAMHAVRMTLPVREGISLIALRGFFTLGAIACATMTMIVAGELAGYDRFRRFTDHELNTGRLCEFYNAQWCSGIDIPCTSIHANSRFCSCGVGTQYYDYPCQPILIAYTQRGLIPLVCLAFMMFVVFLFDGYLHLRLFHIAHLLERRM